MAKEPGTERKARKVAKDRTRFVCCLRPEAKKVYLVGDFNDWDTLRDRMVKRNGRFSRRMRLAPGRYEYKFLIDGEWHTDPAAEAEVPNRYGTTNSVIRV